MTKARIVFFGTSEFAVPILEELAQSPWRPALVVTTPDALAGRGLALKPSPVKVAAERLGIPVIQPAVLSPSPYPLSVEQWDLCIVAAYGKILPQALLKIPRHGSLNVHPSLLPRWRGATPIQHAILAGDEETGVTIFLMDEQVDHGPILKYSKCSTFNVEHEHVEYLEVTTPELTRILAEMGAELLIEAIPEWLAGRIVPRPQEEARATYARRLTKEDGHIDWSCPAIEIERMVRAFQPWPGAYTFWQRGEKRVRLVVEQADSGKRNAPSQALAGTAAVADGMLSVLAEDGELLIRSLKPEGTSAMSSEEFLRGYPDVVGAILT